MSIHIRHDPVHHRVTGSSEDTLQYFKTVLASMIELNPIRLIEELFERGKEKSQYFCHYLL